MLPDKPIDGERANKSTIRRHILTLTASIIILILLILFLREKGDSVLQHLRMVSKRSILGLALLACLHVLVNAFRFKMLLNVFAVHVPFIEWFGLTVTNTMLGYCMPARGGIAVRTLYLKKQHGLSFTVQASLLAGASLLCMLLSAMIAMLLLIVAHYMYDGGLPKVLPVVIIMFLGTGAMTGILASIRPGHIRLRNRRFRKLAQRFIRGLRYFRHRQKPVLWFSLAHLVSLALFGARLLFCFRALGSHISWFQAVIIQSLTDFSTVVQITPGNLGIKEGVSVYLSTRFGYGADIALATAALDRAISIVIVVGLGTLFSQILLRKYSRSAPQC
jgi:uncharacterized protein (TIRG00374 family)